VIVVGDQDRHLADRRQNGEFGIDAGRIDAGFDMPDLRA
jgi:hypothetical protein